jgi:DNA-binding NarL/FixJ family response regulator
VTAPSVLPREAEIGHSEAPERIERSSHMAPSDLRVQVVAAGSLRERIVATLEAGGVGVLNGRPAPPPEIRVIAIDLERPTPLRRLRESLTQAGPGRVVAVAPACGRLGARRAMRAGADSLVLEDELEATLVAAVRAVAAGLTVFPAVLRDRADSLSFSHREREVLRLAIMGHTNGAIASSLFLAESTVKSHLSSAYRKLGAVSRKDAASMVLDPDEGLLEIILGGSVLENELDRAKGEP